MNLVFAILIAVALLTKPVGADELTAGQAYLGATMVLSPYPAPNSWRTYNPKVTQETIATTICVPGYTATVRPPYYITSVIKKRLLEAQGKTWVDASTVELDHQVPLCAGGEPGDIDHTSNFMLQLWPIARRKDRLEAKMGCLICSGQVTLQEGRAAFEDWEASYHRYALIKCRRAGRPQ